MSRPSVRIYKDFDSFLQEAAKTLTSNKKVTPAWLAAVGTVAGTGVLGTVVSGTAAGLGAILGAAVLGTLLGPLGWAVVGGAIVGGSVAMGTSAGRKQMKTLEEQSTQEDRNREIKRLETARTVYEELKLLEAEDREAAREEIAQLFDDMVSGREIMV